MNLSKALPGIYFLLFAGLVFSCNDDEPTAVKSREIRFEVTGNFAGMLATTYVNESGGGTSESIPSLPWNKSITYPASVPSTGISVGATGGVAGQTIRIKVFAGGTLISDTPGVADGSGSVVIAAPSYTF